MMNDWKSCNVCGYFLINDPEAGIVEDGDTCGECQG